MKNSNYLVFVDEAGDHQLGKYPKDFPMFVLAFVIISKDEYCDRLLPRFTRLKLKYFPDVSTIFHERDIRLRKNRFNILMREDVRTAFLSDFSAFMQSLEYKIVAVAVNKDEETKRGNLTEDLYELGVKHGLSLIEEYLKAENDVNYTTLTFEARGMKEDKALKTYFKKHARDIFGIEVHRKSAGGLGLQLADMIARPIGIHLLRPEQSNRSWDIISKKICKDGLCVLPK